MINHPVKALKSTNSPFGGIITRYTDAFTPFLEGSFVQNLAPKLFFPTIFYLRVMRYFVYDLRITDAIKNYLTVTFSITIPIKQLRF